MTKSLVCPNCGGQVIDEGTEFGYCESCGSQIRIREPVKQSTPKYSAPQYNSQNNQQNAGSANDLPVTSFGNVVTGEKSEGLAIFLGIILVGAGMMYAGAVGKGIFYLVISVLLCWTVIVPLIFWILGIVKAYDFCKENNILWMKYRGLGN